MVHHSGADSHDHNHKHGHNNHGHGGHGHGGHGHGHGAHSGHNGHNGHNGYGTGDAVLQCSCVVYLFQIYIWKSSCFVLPIYF